MKKKKILFASTIHRYDDIRIYYKEILSLYKDYDIDFIATGNYKKNVHSYNISIELLPIPSNLIKRIYNNFKIFFKALKGRYSGFHFHDPELILVGCIIKLFKIKIIYDIHEDNLNVIKIRKWIPFFLKPIISNIFNLIEKFAVKFFDGIILAEDSYKNNYIKSKKIVIVRNYVNLLSNHVDIDFNTRNILYVGSLTIERGILDIIKSMNLLQKNNIQTGLFLIGTISKSDEEIILKEINLLPNPNNVKLINYCNHNELIKYIKISKVGVSPLRDNENYQNSIPTKILDYMNWGLPYVYSELKLSKTIFKNNSGGLGYEINNINQLSEKLLILLNDKELCLKLRIQGRKRIKDFNWNNESKKLGNLYQKIF